MQNSRFTGHKGFVFSVDAAVSVIILTAAFFLLTQSSSQNPSVSSSALQATIDAGTAIQNSGYLSNTLDTNDLDQSAILLRQKMLELLPQNLEARVELKKYELNLDTCRTNQDFESCFLQTEPETATAGPALPQKEISSTKSLSVLGEKAGQCDLEVELQDKKTLNSSGPLFFSALQNQTLFFQEEENPLDIDFNVTVEPQGTISCDENITVTLQVSVPESVRSPIDMMLVLDRSGSMSWSGEATANDPVDVWLSGTTAFIADGIGGLRSFDVTNPFIPASLDRYDPGTVVDLGVEGDYVFLAETSITDELIAIDASDTSDLQEIDQIDFDLLNGIYVDSGYAYIAGENDGANDSGLIIVDVSNPSSMNILGNINTTDPQDVFVIGDYAYFADGTAGFKTFNVANKNNPALLDSINTPGDSQGVTVQGNYAYIADGGNGLVIIDVSDPSSISNTGSYNTPGFAYNVFTEGTNAYIADGSSLQKINISDPQNPFLEREYLTPYSYEGIITENNIGYVGGGSGGFITLDLTNGERIANAKEAAKAFVDFNGWKLPPDQIGLSTFNSSATLDEALTTSKTDLNNAIDALISSGGTNIESGINIANSQLTGAGANPAAMKFEIVLSDGQSTGGNSATAAQTAANAGITIFTIGFGEDADEAELTTIATTTDGEYYAASDQNALLNIFTIIAAEIAQRATDANVVVPTINGATIFNSEDGNFVDGNIVFNAGDIASGEGWSTTYTLNFPCNNINNCSVDAITLPGDGTQLTYIDSNGNSNTIDFNSQITLDFKKRNLTVNIANGTISSDEEVYLDVVIQNVAELDANTTDLNFFITSITGEPIITQALPALCSTETPGCTQSTANFTSVFIPQSGKIYATIGDGNNIRECPANNTDAALCTTNPPASFVQAQYFVWRK